MQALLSGLLSNGGITGENPSNNASTSVTIDILPNAEISVLDQNLLPPSAAYTEGMENDQESEKQKNSLSKLSRALVVSGDIGVWTEWASKWNRGHS